MLLNGQIVAFAFVLDPSVPGGKNLVFGRAPDMEMLNDAAIVLENIRANVLVGLLKNPPEPSRIQVVQGGIK